MLEHDASDPSLTATHQVMGTLRYMAPEQMQGSRQVATGVIHCAVGVAALILMLIAVAPELIFKEQGGFPRWALLIAAPVALSLIVGWLMISGGLKMPRLKSYGSAVAASVAAILPCGPVGMLEMVVGIWALITLNRSQVRAAFSSAKANAAGQAGARGFEQAGAGRLDRR